MNPITRKETFLAAAGGQDVTTPTPITREEAFLDAIVKGGGSSLPSTETASAGDVLSLDDNKDPQWAPPSGSGGGVLVVNMIWNDGGTIATLDKTWNEINSAGFNVALESDGGFDNYYTCSSIYTNPMDGTKQIDYIGNAGGGALTAMTFTAATASDYPTYNAE